MLRYLPLVSMVLGTMPPAHALPASAVQASTKCSINSLPEPQKRKLIDGYAARYKSQGKASANAWARAQEDAIYGQLVARGACPATRSAARTTPKPAPARTARKPILNRQGKPCRDIAVENQVFPGFGGEPMRMALVQVCKD